MEGYESLIKATQAVGVTFEQLIDGLGKYNDAMLHLLALEMLEKGFCSFGNGIFGYLDGTLKDVFENVIGMLEPNKRFLDIYGKLVQENGSADKTEILLDKEE